MKLYLRRFLISKTGHFGPRRQRGASLVVSLVMLAAVLMLGLSATQIALQGEKASRSDRDRQVALQAAEAAMMDAEMDIERSPDAANSRSSKFSEKNPALDVDFPSGCGQGTSLGLCRLSTGSKAAWLKIDFTDESSSARTVPFGTFTGQSMQVNKGLLPRKLPRYIIEVGKYNQEGEGTTSADMTYFYRITAMGFGARDSTQVVLQSFYKKND